MPSDGMPLFPTWKTNAMDMFYTGYERFREPMQCRLRDGGSEHGFFQCTKGLGRLSVIYFGVLWTFLHKDDVALCGESMGDFVRWGWRKVNMSCLPLSHLL